jgi:hypothetical protein
MTELYNRYFTKPIEGEGVKIHIEVFVKEWKDAVEQMMRWANDIKDDYDRDGHYYTNPFGPNPQPMLGRTKGMSGSSSEGVQ